MIVLLEGLSRVGKSVLANRLQADLPGFKRLHFGPPDIPDAYEFFTQELREIEGEDVIIDRLHWSNFAYQSLFGGSVLTDFDHYRIDAWLANQPCVAILLVGEPHAIYDRIREERVVVPVRHVLASPRQIGEVQNRFRIAFERSSIGAKWSFGLDQIMDSASGTVTEVYARLLGLLKGEEVLD